MQFTKYTTLTTQHSKEVCIERILGLIDTSWLQSEPSQPLLGRVDGDRFWLNSKYEGGNKKPEHRYRHMGSSRLTLHVVRGSLIPFAQGTHVKIATEKLHPVALVVAVFLILVPIFAYVMSVASMIIGWISFEPTIIGTGFFLLFMYLVSFVAYSVKSDFTQSEQQIVLDKLKIALDCSDSVEKG